MHKICQSVEYQINGKIIHSIEKFFLEFIWNEVVFFYAVEKKV